MFSSLANSKTGINVAKIMINPPIVGVPAFSFCPFKPKSLIDSPICLTLRPALILSGKAMESKYVHFVSTTSPIVLPFLKI